jgi:hypothetical protein
MGRTVGDGPVAEGAVDDSVGKTATGKQRRPPAITQGVCHSVRWMVTGKSAGGKGTAGFIRNWNHWQLGSRPRLGPGPAVRRERLRQDPVTSRVLLWGGDVSPLHRPRRGDQANPRLAGG